MRFTGKSKVVIRRCTLSVFALKAVNLICVFSCHFFLINSPEPHILLFRRPLGTDPQSGRVDPELVRAAREEYKDQFGLLRK